AAGSVDFTLTEDNYKKDLGLNYANFNSVADAKELIPGLLSDLYPSLGKTSSAKITFDVYAPKPAADTIISYEVTVDDYDAYPASEKYNNFDDMDQVYTFLNDKYPDVENKTLISLTYKFFDGTLHTYNDGFLYVDGDWQFIPGITDEEYTMMGEGYPDFSSKDEAAQKLPIFLKDKYKYGNVEAGDIQPIMYKYYSGGLKTDIMYFVYDGANWGVYNDTVTQTIQFGHNGTTWVPDNTIRYSLNSTDYAIIAGALADKYPGPVDNMTTFSDFDRRPDNAAYWKDEMILEAMNVLLDEIAPNAEVGQKYVITYAIYDGSNGTNSISLIKAEDGSWKLNNAE
ncbi:MAG: hypothetical protein WBV11_14165, partial [Salegentibacter sp.]